MGDITDNKKIIKKKYKIYKNERTDILNKIINIIGLHFFSHELDTNKEKQEKIYALEEDIKKYFSVGNWPAYKSKSIVEKRAISIVRSILKDMDIDVESKNKRLKEDRWQIMTTEYTIKYEKVV